MSTFRRTTCILNSLQNCSAAAQDEENYRCATEENTCYCADGAAGGLSLSEIALSLARVKAVKLC